MFRFANIDMLWLLAIVPVLAVAYAWFTYRKRRQLREFGDEELVALLMPNASRIRPTVKFAILMVTMALLIIAAARPQFKNKDHKEEESKNGIEAIVAIDVSNSMLANDVSPDRMERAKQMVSKLIDNMLDDRVGLVVFAGDAYIQLPITNDAASAKMFLSSISPGLIRLQGTAIGAAIDKSMDAFGETSDAGKALIIITDGENHEDDAEAAAARAKEAGIKVIVVGIGSTQGKAIPLGNGDYLKDREGKVVVSKLNEEMCKQIAKAGGGIYVHCDNTNTAQKAIQKELEDLQKQKFTSTSEADYNEQFHSFALIALLLLVIEFVIFNRKNKAISRLDIFGEGRV